MSATVTTEQVPSRWHRPLERIVFVVPVVLGIAFVAGRFVDPAVVAAGAMLLSIVGGFAYSVALAAAVYLDAGAVGAAGIDWQPSQTAYAIGVFLFPIVALHYLYVRYRHVRPAHASGQWWYAVPASTVLLLASLIVGAVTSMTTGPFLAAQGLALLVLPIAVYRDAAYLRSADADWQPDPPTHLLLAVFATVFAIVQPLYVGYYVLRRWRSVGLR